MTRNDPNFIDCRYESMAVPGGKCANNEGCGGCAEMSSCESDFEGLETPAREAAVDSHIDVMDDIFGGFPLD